MQKKLFLFTFVFLAALSLSGCVFKSKTPVTYKVDLEVWGVFDDSDAYTELFNEYKKINPYVRSITYRKLPVETYKEDLLDALASGKGPDIFMIRNSWAPSFQDKIVAAPEEMIGEKKFRDSFVDVAADDFIGEDKKVYGVPLSVDSLALYYNKDLFNAAGIAKPPATWEEVASASSQLSQIDSFGNLNQSGIALGTGKNINRSTDVLSALFFQKESGISSDRSQFRITDAGSIEAFNFYTQFSRIDSGVYSWNPRLHYSVDAFYEGTLGMMINYSWQYPALKQKNAKLNIGVAPMPQFSGTQPENYANYWGFAVAKNKTIEDQGTAKSTLTPDQKKALHTHESWQLLRFLAFPHPEKMMTLVNGLSGNSKDFPIAFDPTEKYLEKTKKPAARRDLIEVQKNDPILAPFASGNLIAKNWKQKDPEAVETILAEMIESVNTGQQGNIDALRTAENRLKLLK